MLRNDPFSFTFSEEAWRTQSWLVELGYGWLEQTTGSLQWIPTMMFLVMGATLTFVGLAIYGVVRDPARTAVGMAAGAWVGMLFVVPRPVIFSFLLLAVFVVVLRHSERLLWTLVPLSWLWASVHGLFVVGLALIALEALRRSSWRLLGVGVIAGLTTLLTAHGLGLVEILVDFAENREALGLLSEWKQPDFLSRGLLPAIAVGAALVVVFARRRLEARYLVVVLPFVLMGALQLRSVFPAMIVLIPLASVILRTDDTVRERAPGSPVINKGIAAAIVLLALIGLARPIGRDTEVLPPAEAVAALQKPRIFHGPGAGGLLIWSELPDRQVFLDDRAELFGATMFQDFLDARNAETGTEMLDRFDLDEALVKTEWPIADELAGLGWEETYRDENWTVLVRP